MFGIFFLPTGNTLKAGTYGAGIPGTAPKRTYIYIIINAATPILYSGEVYDGMAAERKTGRDPR